jgi:outer membrane protein W
MKTCIKWSIEVALIVILFLPLSVIAQTTGAPPAGSPPREAQGASVNIPNYFAVKAGAYFPEDKWDVLDLGVFEYSLDTGFNGDLVFGHYFNKNWALEFGIGYFYTSGDDTLGTTRSKADMDVMPVTLAVKGIIPVDKWEIYGIGGIGAYFVWADEKLNGIKFSDDDILFGGFLGAGVSYNITPQAFLGLEGKYLWTDKSSFSDAGWRAKQKLDGWIATFNVGFRF